mgnify:CR=1 FL=1
MPKVPEKTTPVKPVMAALPKLTASVKPAVAAAAKPAVVAAPVKKIEAPK